MKILIVDDHVLFRDGLTSLLESQIEFTVVGQAGTVAQGLNMVEQFRPDVILISVELPDGSGLEATQKIISRMPDANIVILSEDNSEDFVLTAIHYGALGVVPKNMPKEHFLASIRGVQHGEAALSRKMTRRLIQEFIRISKINRPEVDGSIESLTFREMEVFRMLGIGASNREIADALNIAENTVKSHVHKILEKLHLRSRLEARSFAHRIGQVNGRRAG